MRLSSFFGDVVDVVEEPAKVWFSSDGFLDDLIELLAIFAHEGSCIPVQRLFQISCLNIF